MAQNSINDPIPVLINAGTDNEKKAVVACLAPLAKEPLFLIIWECRNMARQTPIDTVPNGEVARN